MQSVVLWVILTLLVGVGWYKFNNPPKLPNEFNRFSTASDVLQGIDLTGKRAIVSGASSGIGFETAKALASRGCSLILACRTVEKGEIAKQAILDTYPNANIDVLPLELASFDSIRSFAEVYLSRKEGVDILINNAGVLLTPHEARTQDGLEMTIGVNFYGTFLLTNLMIPCIKARNGRIVIVASLQHENGEIDFDDLTQEKDKGGMARYATSKLMLVLFARELNQRLKDVSVNTLCPGVIATNITRHLPDWLQSLYNTLVKTFLPLINYWIKTPQQGAATTVYVATNDDIIGGEYYQHCNQSNGSDTSRNMTLAHELFERSQEIVGVEFNKVNRLPFRNFD